MHKANLEKDVSSKRNSTSKAVDEFDHGAYVRAMPGHMHSGDHTFASWGPHHVTAGIVDVSGHGFNAYAVGEPVVQYLGEQAGSASRTPLSLLELSHKKLRGTRGAAITILQLSGSKGMFAGVGNVQCLHIRFDAYRRATCQYYHPKDGMLGARFRPGGLMKFEFERGDVLLMHSDGVRMRPREWRITELFRGSATNIAQSIVNRFGRDSDDASCCVIRRRASRPR